MCLQMKKSKFIFVAATIVLLLSLGCSFGSATDHKADTSPPNTLDKEQITDDFRRLRKGCSENDLWEFSFEDEMLYRRVFPTPLSELGTKVRFAQFCQFKGVELITNFFPNQPSGQALVGFIANRPNSEELAEGLENILIALDDDPTGEAGIRFDTVFAIPQLAVFAAMQPYLATVNTGLRTKFGIFLMSKWLNEYALNPEKYQSRDDILRILNEVREAGYIDYWN